MTWTRRSRNPSARRAAEISARRRRPAEEDREARAAAAAARGEDGARRATGACQGGAGGRGAERLATRTTLKKREDTKNTQTPVGELSREALLERARARTRRANAAGDTTASPAAHEVYF